MKVIGYETKKVHTTEIVKAMLEPHEGQLLSTEHFLANGLPQADLIIISGILRGTGLVYKECVKQGRDFLFIDHAYFLKGYEHPNWMRITKNRHTFGPALKNKPGDRFQQHFSAKYQLSPWRGPADGPILVLPPTNALAWLFGAHTWEDNILREIRRYTDHPIKVREKPEDPIVDALGNLTQMKLNPSKDVPLSEDIKNARAVVVYNSNSAIECVKMGVPVICTENCAAYPISFAISDLRGTKAFEREPSRQQLFNDLAYSQFTRAEMQAGLPYESL
jgi:hypothetical protein